MIPGRISCPTGYTLEYNGYIMANYYQHQRSDFVCVDAAPELAGSSANNDGNLWYPTEIECGSLRAAPAGTCRIGSSPARCAPSNGDRPGSPGGESRLAARQAITLWGALFGVQAPRAVAKCACLEPPRSVSLLRHLRARHRGRAAARAGRAAHRVAQRGRGRRLVRGAAAMGMAVCLHARVAMRVLLAGLGLSRHHDRRALRRRPRRGLERVVVDDEHARRAREHPHARGRAGRGARSEPLGLRGAQGQGRGRRHAARQAGRAPRRRRQGPRRRPGASRGRRPRAACSWTWRASRCTGAATAWR